MIVDYPTFTEVDPNTHLALVGTDHLDFDAYRNEDCYLYKDYSADYFDDFTHKVDIKVSGMDVGDRGTVWALADEVNDAYYFWLNNKKWASIKIQKTLGDGIRLYLVKSGLPTGNTTQSTLTLSELTWYYLTITKSGTSLSCKIYSDSARTTLLDTVVINFSTDAKFRYLYGCNTSNNGDPNVCTFDIENLFISPFYTTIARVKKRVKHLSSSLTDIDINENIQRAEGFIDFTMRASGRGSSPDFIFDAVKHSAIRQCCTDLAAFYTMSYNPGGTFLTLANAQMTANLLWDAAERTLLKLADPRSVEYLKGL